MANGLSNYSTFLSKVCALIGIPQSGLTTDEGTFLKTFFSNQMNNIWSDSNWMSICPYGEARFAGNLIYYPNDLSKTSYWTATNLTITANSLSNPADGRVTASKCLETSTTGSHGYSQSYLFIPSVNYQYSVYIRPNGRNYVQLVVNDGVNSYTSFFNCNNGSVGTYSTNLPQSPTIAQQNNGFWQCTVYLTSASTAATGYVQVLLSTDGSTTSYAGDTTKGVWSWGNLFQQTSYAYPTQFHIPLDQLGESEIDVVYQVWATNPNSQLATRPQGYALNPDNIQIIGPAGYWGYGVNYSAFPNGYTTYQNPFYLYYRKGIPDYSGDAYDASLAYGVDDQMLFTNSSNVSNFYKCTVAATAGQSPVTTPGSWELIEIPDQFLYFAVYGAYADWLRMDGQLEKAAAMDQMAQSYQDQEADRAERQEGWVMPIKFQSHVTSQARTW
jgi:hypothetical protein